MEQSIIFKTKENNPSILLQLAHNWFVKPWCIKIAPYIGLIFLKLQKMGEILCISESYIQYQALEITTLFSAVKKMIPSNEIRIEENIQIHFMFGSLG